jgi:hypothetical protein
MSYYDLRALVANNLDFETRLGRTPSCLYLGRQQAQALDDIINETKMVVDPKLHGERTQFMGLYVYRVDAEDHLRIA